MTRRPVREDRPVAAAASSTLCRLVEESPWLLAVLVGTVLRGYRLLTQIPVDDEWHTLHKIVSSGYAEIASSFGASDYSIPITLFFKLVADTVGLSELWLRAPFFLVGVAALVLLPWVVRRRLGRRSSYLFAWLLALSPLLVFYSRFARPYGITAVLGLLSLSLFDDWWERARRRHAILYVLCVVVAGYLSLTVLPFVLAPLVVLPGVVAVRSPRELPAVARRLMPVVIGVMLALAVSVLPPALADPSAILGKTGSTELSLGAARKAMPLLLGTRQPGLEALLLVLGLAGAWRAWRTAPRWTALTVAASCLTLVALAVVAPFGCGAANVLARYLLPLLPVLLMLIAVTLASLCAGPWWRPASMVAPLVLLVVFAAGPLLESLSSTRHWFASVMMLRLSGKPSAVTSVPGFYRELAEQPPYSLTLVEAPWYFSLWDNVLPVYEAVHRQRQVIGFVTGLCARRRAGEYRQDAPGMRLRSFVHLGQRSAMCRRGIDYIVFHKEPSAELAQVVDARFVAWIERQAPDAATCLDALRQRWGSPVYEDSDLAVFSP